MSTPRGHKDKSFVGKIISSTKEFENIQLFSRLFPQYSFLSQSTIEVYKYQLIMPKIEGIELFELLNSFKIVDNKTNKWNDNFDKDLPIIDIQTFDNLLSALIKLYDFVVIMNNENLYHNDISTKNVIYKDGSVTLIDFEKFGNKNDMFEKEPDLSGLTSILSEIIGCGIFSPEIRKIIEEYDSRYC